MPQSIEIKNLVDRFSQNISSYSASSYNETQLRQEFLNPFFETLGWDVSNRQGYAEAYKEVIHEDAVKIGTATKAPDYSFRVGGTRKFFVEAKKPFVNIKDDIEPAFQLRRYAWSAKLPLSILTDFEEFAVYDCRLKPVKTDKASIGRILYIKYDEYEKRWDEISSIFSKEAVLKGSFDKYAETNKAKKGTTEVDDAFLTEIEGWRDVLARNIAIRNERLSWRELNFAVQRTIDRLIFLRICEDRGIEDYGQLLSHINGENIYRRLRTVFQKADDRYNSGLFHFNEEKGRRETPDNITLKLDIDDKVLRQIIQNLYYPDCAYEFSVLPSDILGQVYEQFLGKVIRLTAGHQAKVEDKPDVKKAGGVFYTPTYIVDYIVKNTVGKLLEGKTPKQVAALRVLDPACGSGSFLIGAYQHLLDWHRDWYTKNDPEKWLSGRNPTIYKARAGEFRLTTPERKKILLNNIYGVDIDTQAVEVTKLSLLLKVLEGENEQSIAQQLRLFHERALPDLGNNIKCGNSLIGNDYFHFQGLQESMGLYADEEDENFKINAFDWDGKDGFQETMKNGGFDAVIGNPPYGASFSKDMVSYFQKTFKVAQGELDSYALFMERSINLLNNEALLGIIVPDTWLTLINNSHLRHFILMNFTIVEIDTLNEFVFLNATIDPLLLFIKKELPNSNHNVFVNSIDKKCRPSDCLDFKKPSKTAQKNWVASSNYQINVFITKDNATAISKCRLNSTPLSELIEYRAGCKPYEVGKGFPPQTKQTLIQKPFTSFKKEATDWKPLIRGDDVQRYSIKKKKPEYIKYGKWLAAPREWRVFSEDRLLIQAIRNPSIERRIISSYTNEDIVSRINVYSLFLKAGSDVQYTYLLGVLNSSLMNWLLKKIYGLHTYVITGILQLPIKIIDKSNSKSVNSIISLVSTILSLYKKLPLAKTDQEKTIIQRQIDSADRRIDELVYELYGLTEEEIEIVEGVSERR
jgi:type I restriction-modification system DNA methylase subunit/predicted type IV restriction endonuclease